MVIRDALALEESSRKQEIKSMTNVLLITTKGTSLYICTFVHLKRPCVHIKQQ